MVELTLTERTEPFTLEEVFDFIDDTRISKIDAHELKSRIVDVVHETRNKAIDEFAHELKETLNRDIPLNYESTRPYFTLENARLIVEEVEDQLKRNL